MDVLELGKAAAKGAVSGSMIPGVGTALGAAGGVALDLAPELGHWLFGPGSDTTVKAVQDAVETVTGTAEPESQVAALADPQLATQLRIQLASIAADRAAHEAQATQERLASQLADIANARSTTVQLAQTGSPMAWGAAVVSIIVLGTFAAVMTLTLFRALPQNAEPVLNVLLGTLSAMATSVVSYWVGSSVGSARKDDRLNEMIKQHT